MKKLFKFIAWVIFYLLVLLVVAIIGEEVIGKSSGAFAGPVVSGLLCLHIIYLSVGKKKG